MKRWYFLLIILIPFSLFSQPLKITENGRHLLTADGNPFFWLGDTGWELFHRLDREEAAHYLETRKKQGFNIIQAVLLHELEAFESPNAYGDFPLRDENISFPDTTWGSDPADPEMYDYWDHADYIIEKTIEAGLMMALLPCWGEYVTPRFRERTISTENQAYSYGFFLGERYRRFNNRIVWVLGGDRLPDEAPNGINIWRAMAEGITDGVNNERGYNKSADYNSTFMTYHCYASSSRWFHKDPWIDIHTWGSYHEKKNNERAYYTAYQDWVLPNPKPTLNSEPCYELLPVNYDWKNAGLGRFDDFDVRQAAWWSVMSGTCGHSYGCNPVWQMYKKENPVEGLTDLNEKEWHEALQEPGANHMKYLKDLILSRFSDERSPDLLILKRNPHDPVGRLVACSSLNCVMVYNPTGKNIGIDNDALAGKFLNVTAWWFNPRNGESELIGSFDSQKDELEFKPPGNVEAGNDWVLILDNASVKFPSPGKKN